MQTSTVLAEDFGLSQEIGDKHYRSWVGPSDEYDLVGALQLNALVTFGLREYHKFLDIGCGSLRGGRFFITFLRPGNYYGVEPAEWALEDGKRAHLGKELIALKRPVFSTSGDFSFSHLGEKFDYVMAHSVFTHASAKQIKKCMLEVQEVMKPETQFIATYHEYTSNYLGDQFMYPKISHYTKDFITELVESAGLRCTHIDLPHPFDQKWFVATRKDFSPDLDRVRGHYAYSFQGRLDRLGMERDAFYATMLPEQA